MSVFLSMKSFHSSKIADNQVVISVFSNMNRFKTSILLIILSLSMGFAKDPMHENTAIGTSVQADVELKNETHLIYEMSKELSSRYFNAALNISESLDQDLAILEIIICQDKFVDNLKSAKRMNDVVLMLQPKDESALLLSQKISQYLHLN